MPEQVKPGLARKINGAKRSPHIRILFYNDHCFTESGITSRIVHGVSSWFILLLLIVLASTPLAAWYKEHTVKRLIKQIVLFVSICWLFFLHYFLTFYCMLTVIVAGAQVVNICNIDSYIYAISVIGIYCWIYWLFHFFRIIDIYQ